MESLERFFTYNSDIEQAESIFLSLDLTLKKLHSEGKCVDVNSKTIAYDNGWIFTRVYNGLNKDVQNKNIESLAKLASGTYFSLPSGTFFDYSNFPTESIKMYFDSMEPNIPKKHPDDSYYREVLINGNTGYYNDYLNSLKKQSSGKGNNRTLSYSTPQGRAMSEKEAAYVNIVFYPIIISLFIVLSYMVYILVK